MMMIPKGVKPNLQINEHVDQRWVFAVEEGLHRETNNKKTPLHLSCTCCSQRHKADNVLRNPTVITSLTEATKEPW